MAEVKRIFVEKKPDCDIEAQNMLVDLKKNLGIKGLEGLRILNRYDIAGISEEEYQASRDLIFSEPTVDRVYDEEIVIEKSHRVFALEYLPGQYDQRADSASQCVQITTQKETPVIKTAKVVILKGHVSDDDFKRVKNYYINPVDSREAQLDKPDSLEVETSIPEDVIILAGFINKNLEELKNLVLDMGLAMTFEDLKFCQAYFRDEEKRDPSITEIRVLDTYWSDHCRHTTFLTEINKVDIQDAEFTKPIQDAYEEYKDSDKYLYGKESDELCLMDIAIRGMKELRKKDMLKDLDVSEEINACSINVDVDVDGEIQQWLVMFKNETHNHPTEIEPFGGAATCLGGAIRDPLSGRSYVYQAMRVTGSGDPRKKINETLSGKLPQRKITIEAAQGYSSYGNQIGLATGHVTEIYDEGYVAKRMEIGAVIGATPKNNVVREVPIDGDAVILLGGRTGRDGCGGATGSSKVHTEDSITTCGAEVQKGNPPTERKIQRLFRNPKVSNMIKRCNDFGAGGVCVAIGELAEALTINLDKVPKKYEGLDGTELAISESQERMAVVIDKGDVESFIRLADEENLEATQVATVTSDNRLKMHWRGKTIVDINRDFLNTNGATQTTSVFVEAPSESDDFFKHIPVEVEKHSHDLKEAWLVNLERLNVCSQRGLVERFDSTIGAGTVLMPFGGKHQLTPAESMVAKIPVLSGDTTTGTAMSYGYNPVLSKWSPFHGALYAVIEAATKIVAVGGNYKNIRLTLQEYFERLGTDPVKWGKPFSSLLGAYFAQKRLGIPAIGGKDSMSGTFEDLTVPPTLVAFGVNTLDVRKVVSPEFKSTDSIVVRVLLPRDKRQIPDFEVLDKNFTGITQLIKESKVLAAHIIGTGGLAEAVSKMCFGNKIGLSFNKHIDFNNLFSAEYGSIVLEIGKKEDLTSKTFEGVDFELIGNTQSTPIISINGVDISIDEAINRWEEPLEKVFPSRVENVNEKEKNLKAIPNNHRNMEKCQSTFGKPRVIIPVFPGTNCEYDSAKAFEKAGGIVDTVVFKNLGPSHIEESIDHMVKGINNSQIIMIPGGFSAGDEPEGSGKFIAAVFRNPRVKESVMDLLENRDGLMLGICNGFQALVKLGLLPFGDIRDIEEEYPTLTFNRIGRHVSRMVRTKVVSTISPWFNNVRIGDIHTIPVSHGEGRFIAGDKQMEKLITNGQVATQYVDMEGNPTYDILYNPNGSMNAIEGITSLDGRILGKMAHSERIGSNVAINIPGEKDQKIFEAGVEYFI